MKININTIQPVGNFKEILLSAREKANQIISRCREESKYNKSIGDLLKLTFTFIHSLEEGIKENQVWNIDEAKQCFIYASLISIDLNSTAQKYLNNIEPEERGAALTDYLQSKSELFPSFEILN